MWLYPTSRAEKICFLLDETHKNPHFTPQKSTIIQDIKPVIKCECCEKIFSRKDALKRHKESYCKRVISIQKVIEDLIIKQNEQQNEIDDLKRKNQQLIKVSDDIPSHNNIVNINNTINNTINNNTVIIKAFGLEKITHVAEDILIKVLNSGNAAIPTYLNEIRFNDRYPENNNVYIVDEEATIGFKYDTFDIWIEDTVDNICRDVLEEIQDKIYDLTNKEKLVNKCELVKVQEAREVSDAVSKGNNKCYITNTIKQDDFCKQLANIIRKKIVEISHKVPINLNKTNNPNINEIKRH